MRVFLGPLAGILTASAIACGSDGGADGNGTVPPTPAVLSSIQISGNTELTAVGQTTQLSLTAGYTNGTNRDVTTEASWITQTPVVATVARGVVTAVGLGTATINATFGGFSAFAGVNVAPAGTFIVDGRAREPGGGNLANVRVVEQVSFTDTRTTFTGAFQFTARELARIRIELPDYEVFEREVRPDPPRRSVFLDAPLQRTIRINSGLSRGDLYVAPNDVSYTIGGDLCDPCKLIRVSSASGALTLRLSWTVAPSGALKMWVNGTRNSTTGSSITVSAPTNGGQSLVYVGWLPAVQPNSQSQYAFFSLSVD
jgi:hypothetical protein